MSVRPTNVIFKENMAILEKPLLGLVAKMQHVDFAATFGPIHFLVLVGIVAQVSYSFFRKFIQVNIMNKLLLTAAIAALIPASAMAQDGAFKKSAGDILLRGRAIAVIPSENADLSGSVTGNDQLSIDNTVVPELDLTYFLTDNIGIEVIAAVTPHDITGKGAVDGVDFGRVWLLPPTVTLQYHFDPIEQVGGISPYVGAGVNYTHFFNAGGYDRSVISDMDFGSSWGGALQVGVDVPLTSNWVLNADVKKIWINSDVDVTLAGGGTVKADTDINPWVVGVGVGYKF